MELWSDEHGLGAAELAGLAAEVLDRLGWAGRVRPDGLDAVVLVEGEPQTLHVVATPDGASTRLRIEATQAGLAPAAVLLDEIHAAALALRAAPAASQEGQG